VSWEGLNLVCDLNSVSDDLNRVLLGGLNFKLCSTDGLNLVPGSCTAQLVNLKL